MLTLIISQIYFRNRYNVNCVDILSTPSDPSYDPNNEYNHISHRNRDSLSRLTSPAELYADPFTFDAVDVALKANPSVLYAAPPQHLHLLVQTHVLV